MSLRAPPERKEDPTPLLSCTPLQKQKQAEAVSSSLERKTQPLQLLTTQLNKTIIVRKNQGSRLN